MAEVNPDGLPDEIMSLLDRIRDISEGQCARGIKEIDVASVLAEAGEVFAPSELAALGIPARLSPPSGTPWTDWFPWRQIYSSLWKRKHPDSFQSRAYLTEIQEDDTAGVDDEMLVMP